MGNGAHVAILDEVGCIGRCVPDFSCCLPSLEASEEVREAFVAARPAIKEEFLAGFLVALFALDAPNKIAVCARQDRPCYRQGHGESNMVDREGN